MVDSEKEENLCKVIEQTTTKLGPKLGLLTASLFIRLKLRLVKYCTKVYANRRNHSYPSFFFFFFTHTLLYFTKSPLPPATPGLNYFCLPSIPSIPERRGQAAPSISHLHSPSRKAHPQPSVHRMAIKARRNFKYLTPRVILRPKADSSHLLKSTQGL